MAGGTALVAFGALLAWMLKPTPPAAASHRTEVQVTLPSTDVLDESANNLAISPDGRTIAYVATRDGVARLYVRSLSSFEAVPLAGTEGALNPFFSPDSRWIGFFAQEKLKKIPVGGGAAQAITAAGRPSGGGSWGEDGAIVYAPATTTGSVGLWRVSANGGAPVKLTTPNLKEGEYSHRYPQILPGGKAALFTAVRGFGWDESRVEALVLATGERRVLIRGGHTGRYAGSGHLLYYRAGSLLDVPFDPERLEVGSASPVTIADDVLQNFGPIGNYRTADEAGRAIDPSVMFTVPPLAPNSAAGSVSFGQLLASSGVIKDCSVQKISSYAIGNMIRTYNTCEVNDIRAKTDGTVASLFKQVALSSILRARAGGMK